MKINPNALKALELKLAEFSKANGSIATHESANANCKSSCSGDCTGNCFGSCAVGCTGGNITSPPQSPKY